MSDAAVDEIQNALAPIFQKYGVDRALIFGSFARGEATRHSDVDLMIVQRTGKRWFDRYEGIYLDILNAICGRSVDLLIYTPDEFEQLPSNPVMRRALRESKVIYECERES